MRKFSSLIALTTGIVGLIGAAATASADGYVGRGAACCQFSWTGFYVGINGGYGFAGDDQTVTNTETVNGTPTAAANFGSLSIAGGFGGLQVGYNAQAGRWVLGVEADLQGGDISDKSHATVNNFLPGLNATVDTKNSVGWFGTLRPRIGYSWDRTLVYATGGVAFGSIKHSFHFTDNFNFTAQDNVSFAQIGYAVGGGVEHKFSPRLSIKVEYQYIDLGSHDHKAPLFFVPAGVPIATAFAENTKTQTDFHTVRIGLNYQFHDRSEAPLK
jgi:outer membrane immunogenic protein